MLRHYEKLHLITPKHLNDYAYRVYDEDAVRRLRQILILRKLRIPLKDIAAVFADPACNRLLEVLQDNLGQIEDELSALQTIRQIMQNLIRQLNTAVHTNISLDLLNDADLCSMVQALQITKPKLKEELSMNELNRAEQTLSALKNVRILYLPPCTVAASHYFGENPEDHAQRLISTFIRENKLWTVKPDFRLFGFNNPSPQANETYGYEYWVTIPEDLDVPAPLVKKQFAGGLYAAHCIKMGDFQEWQLLFDWVNQSTAYDYEPREPFGMGGCFEEHLNPYTYYTSPDSPTQFAQLDLLTPIKEK